MAAMSLISNYTQLLLLNTYMSYKIHITYIVDTSNLVIGTHCHTFLYIQRHSVHLCASHGHQIAKGAVLLAET